VFDRVVGALALVEVVRLTASEGGVTEGQVGKRSEKQEAYIYPAEERDRSPGRATKYI